MKIKNLLTVVFVLGAAFTARASVIYTINQTGIGFDNGSLTGTVVTDGATGTLAASDIVSWNLQATCALAACASDNFTLTGKAGGNSTLSLTGGLTATATQLLFNYGSGGVSAGVFEFANGSNAWALGLSTGGQVYEEILPLGTAGTALPQTGTQVIGTVTSAVPEPSSPLLLGAGLLGLGVAAKRNGRLPRKAGR